MTFLQSIKDYVNDVVQQTFSSYINHYLSQWFKIWKLWSIYSLWHNFVRNNFFLQCGLQSINFIALLVFNDGLHPMRMVLQNNSFISFFCFFLFFFSFLFWLHIRVYHFSINLFDFLQLRLQNWSGEKISRKILWKSSCESCI